jgi:hypothetical protein
VDELEPVESVASTGLARRAAGYFIAGINFVRHQLATSDQNPHEGRLRGSVMPAEYIEVPDYPPLHDDTI